MGFVANIKILQAPCTMSMFEYDARKQAEPLLKPEKTLWPELSSHLQQMIYNVIKLSFGRHWILCRKLHSKLCIYGKCEYMSLCKILLFQSQLIIMIVVKRCS